MASTRNSTLRKPAALRKRLFRLERSGRYLDALQELSEIWPDISLSPDLSGFPSELIPEFKLRCGALAGFYAHVSQLYSQRISMDLLTAARVDFETSGDIEKIVECDNYLALSYWRTGELREAQLLIESSFTFDLPSDSVVRLHSYIIRCLIGLPREGKDERNLSELKSVEDFFLQSDDDCLKGDYFNHCGMALDNLGRKLEAIEHYELARFYHRRSRHRSYLATVENNLACAYQNSGEFRLAHAAIDSAVRLLRLEKDKTREGFALDTKAGLFLAERRYNEALTTVRKALAILSQSENSAYYVATLQTKSKILLGLDRFHDAVVTLFEAINIARIQTGEDSASQLSAEFKAEYDRLRAGALNSEIDRDSSTVELLIPASLANFSDYRGVWIRNSRLESYGINNGSLAVVGECDVKQGDLVAVADLESGEVGCGFYDCDFGMIGLEGADGELLMYDEDKVRVLGKIIGFCTGPPTKDGRMSVEAIRL